MALENDARIDLPWKSESFLGDKTDARRKSISRVGHARYFSAVQVLRLEIQLHDKLQHKAYTELSY